MYDSNQSVALESGAVTEGAVLNDGLHAAQTHHQHHEHHLLHLHHHEHSPEQNRWLIIRNIFVVVAGLLFVASLFPEGIIGHTSHLLKGVAYMFGALAYGSEFVVLTDCFKKKQSKREMFMPCVFGVLYIILGISYFHH